MDQKKLDSITQAFAGEETIELPKKKKTPSRRRALAWTVWALVTVLALAALGAAIMATRYQNRFLPGTAVLGVDVSDGTVAEAAERLDALAETTGFTLRDGAGEELLTLTLPQLLGEGRLRAETARLLDAQRRESNPLSWLERRERALTIPALDGFTDSDAAALIYAALYGEGTPVLPVNAEIVMDETGYRLVPEVTGNLVDVDGCAAALGRAVRELSVLDGENRTLSVEGARILPEITTQDPLLQRQSQAMDAYLTNPVSIRFFDDVIYTLTPEDIWSVSTVTLTGVTALCTPDKELVTELVNRLIDSADCDGVGAKYHYVAESRDNVFYPNGEYGWKLDRTALVNGVFHALNYQTPAEVIPQYTDYTSFIEGIYWGGNTFVEICIANQYLWFYRNGQLLTQTPVVTGNLANHDDTRRGFFYVTWMKADTTLVGPTWNDHVDYWMPFDDQIGLHDSSWRDEYGGDIYLTDGSHGCVNTPLESMRIIFQNSWEGMPVIVY